jgi:hypothetical protein
MQLALLSHQISICVDFHKYPIQRVRPFQLLGIVGIAIEEKPVVVRYLVATHNSGSLQSFVEQYPAGHGIAGILMIAQMLQLGHGESGLRTENFSRTNPFLHCWLGILLGGMTYSSVEIQFHRFLSQDFAGCWVGSLAVHQLLQVYP